MQDLDFGRHRITTTLKTLCETCFYPAQKGSNLTDRAAEGITAQKLVLDMSGYVWMLLMLSVLDMLRIHIYI